MSNKRNSKAFNIFNNLPNLKNFQSKKKEKILFYIRNLKTNKKMYKRLLKKIGKNYS
jgi:hypothetical protein